jgi:hypothetical protein
MKERLVILLAASGALVLFVTMFLSSERGFGMSREVPRPTSQERSGNGYSAVQQWLAAENIHAVSLQESLAKLFERDDLPATGNVILVTLPVTSGFSSEEYRTLDKWVRAGNALLVAAALADQPDWAHGFGERASNDLNLLTGLQFQRGAPASLRFAVQGARPPSSDRPFIEPQRTQLVPNRSHAYFSGVRGAVALSDFPHEDWAVGIPSDAFVLSLAHDGSTGAAVLWTRSLGQGRVIVSGCGSIFTNRALGLADNARLLANILGANLGAGGSVLFDDIHQGLSATYDPAKFYRDRRLYYTLGILIAVWLTWVLGSTRLAWPSRAGTLRPVLRDAELIRVTGGFFARVLRPDAAARRTFELFFQRLYAQVPRARGADGMPWSYLERHSRVDLAEVRQLRDWYAEACASRRVPLLPLHNLIVRIDGASLRHASLLRVSS